VEYATYLGGDGNESGKVVHSELLNPCLIETSFLMFFDDPTCYFEVLQPVIKFYVQIMKGIYRGFKGQKSYVKMPLLTL
jgi:hypothetical protein